MRLQRPLFLPKSGYRRRRLRDAARLLPLVGAFLMFLPILWAPAPGQPRLTAGDGIYLFVVWAGLILAGLLLSRNPDSSGATPPGEED